MGIVKVNRTGKNVKVYLTNACASNEVIGTLYNNEVFTWTQEYPGSSASGFYVQAITFRNSSGQIAHGWIAAKQTDDILATNLSEMRKKTVTINGKTYFAFKMRRSEELYNGAGNSLGIDRLAFKDRYILSEGSTSGESNSHWLAARYLETGIGTGEYEEIIPNTHAFVDMGYDKGSTMGSDFSLIGSI